MDSRVGCPGPVVKTTRPDPADVLHRERLFRQLDAGRTAPVVWVTGPGGSGKTTLVASYVQSRAVPCAWLRLDEGDADPASFFFYLGRAVETAFPGGAPGLPLLTPEYAANIPGFTRNFFSALYARLRDGGVLVLDNVQDVPDPSFLFEAILSAARHRNRSSTIVLVSRRPPSPAFARLRANRELSQLGPEALRLSPDEFEAVAAEAGLEVADGLLSSLFQKLDGWAAGLHLVIEAARRGALPGPCDGTPVEILEYFGSQVFEDLETRTRSFLLRTGVLPVLTPETAAALSGEDRAGHVLEALCRGNHFTERSRHDPPVYTYHPLFREFLAHRAESELGEARVRDLKARAAVLLERAGQAEAAAALFAEAGDWPGLTRQVLERAPVLAGQGRFQTLGSWISRLPAERRRENPWIAYWHGVCRFPFNPSDALASFERSFKGFRAGGDDGPGAMLAWAGAVEAINWTLSDFRTLESWLDLVPEVVGGPEDVPEGTPGVRFVAGVLAALMLCRPRHPDVGVWEKRALELAGTSEDPGTRARLLFNTAFWAGVRGNTPVAKVALEDLRVLAGQTDTPPFARIMALFGTATGAYYFDPSVRESLDAVEDALTLSRSTGVRVMDFMLLGAAALIHCVQGHPGSAEAYAERMKEILPSAMPWDRGLYHHVLALNAVRRGDPAAGAGHAEASIRLSRQVGNRFTEAQGRAARALSLHRKGTRDEATEEIRTAVQLFQEAGTKYQEFDALLVQAAFLLEDGRVDEGVGTLAGALEIGRDCQFARPYCYAYPWLPDLLSTALAEGIETDYVCSLVRNASVLPAEPHTFQEAWPWRVRIYTLGRFEIVRDDEPLARGNRTAGKPLDLLLALIAHGGRKVAETTLSEALWPDADGDLAHRSFATTLHRLRRLLGVPQALVLRDGCLSLDPQHCWVDAWAFERLWTEAERASVDPEAAATLGQRAVALYRGAFLPGAMDESWSVHRRERLRSRFLRGVERLGRWLEAAGRLEEAVQTYRKALEVDPLIESFHRRLMTCLAALGRPSEVAAAYRDCERALGGVLGIAPSEETRAILDRTVQG